MHLAFEVVAAKPKADAQADAPAQEPMRGSTKQVRKNPSTDQKRVRRKLQRAAVRFDQCAHCGQPIHDANGIDPGVPWVHEASGNAYCDVDVPEDAVMFAGTRGRPEAEPSRHHATRCSVCDGALADKGSDATGTLAACVDCGRRYTLTTDAVLDMEHYSDAKPTAHSAIARRAREVLAQEAGS